MSKEANVGLVTSILAAFKSDAPEEKKEVEEVVEETNEEETTNEEVEETVATETETVEETTEESETKTELNSAELTIQLIESGITDPELLRTIVTAVDTGDITGLLTKLIETKAAKPGTVLDKQEVSKPKGKRSIV